MITQIIEAIKALEGIKEVSKGRQILMNAIGNLAQGSEGVAIIFITGRIPPETLQVVVILKSDPPRPWPGRVYG